MKMIDVMGCVGGAVFILFASALIPFFGPFFSPLTSLPFLFYSTKLGLQEGVKLAVVAILAIGVIATLAGYPEIILYGIELSALGLVLSALFKKKLGVGQTILFASMFMVLLSLGYLFIFGISKDMGPFEMVRGYLHSNLTAAIDASEKMGAPREDVIEIVTYAKRAVDTLYPYFPALMVIIIGYSAWLNVVMARSVFRMGNLSYPEFVPMDRWQAPEVMVWGVIASGFALFLFSGIIQSLAANVLIVLMVIYLFHGLSIFMFFLNKFRLPSWIRAGVCFLIIILLQQFFLLLLAFAGLFDQWVDFRKFRKQSEAS